jgi:hypothetical protein
MNVLLWKMIRARRKTLVTDGARVVHSPPKDEGTGVHPEDIVILRRDPKTGAVDKVSAQATFADLRTGTSGETGLAFGIRLAGTYLVAFERKR